MNLLLDSHAFVWWHEEPKKLSATAFREISSPSNSVFLSIASLWEIQIKILLGKFKLNEKLEDAAMNEVSQNGFTLISVEIEHVVELENLPMHHKDPFDRMLLAQAAVESLTVVTIDKKFSAYGVPLLW